MIHESTWDNVVAVIVQKTLYHGQIKDLAFYRIRDNIQMIEPESLPECNKKHQLALCQEFNCPVIPSIWFEDGSWAAFSPEAWNWSSAAFLPEAWNRYRAIGVVVESHSSEMEGDEIRLDHWLGLSRSSYISGPEVGFTPYVRLLRSPPSFLLRELSGLRWIVQDTPLKSVLALAMPATYGAVHLSAWNFEFPTMFENLLWKIASIVIVTTLPILTGLGLGVSILYEQCRLMFGYFLS